MVPRKNINPSDKVFDDNDSLKDFINKYEVISKTILSIKTLGTLCNKSFYHFPNNLETFPVWESGFPHAIVLRSFPFTKFVHLCSIQMVANDDQSYNIFFSMKEKDIAQILVLSKKSEIIEEEDIEGHFKTLTNNEKRISYQVRLQNKYTTWG